MVRVVGMLKMGDVIGMYRTDINTFKVLKAVKLTRHQKVVSSNKLAVARHLTETEGKHYLYINVKKSTTPKTAEITIRML